MSTTSVEEHVADTHDDEHDHPPDSYYVKIALVLAVITGVEVFTYFESVLDWGEALVPALIVMMVLKFAIIAGSFMHLKFDNRIFTFFFAVGIALALGVYITVLLAFNYWS